MPSGGKRVKKLTAVWKKKDLDQKGDSFPQSERRARLYVQHEKRVGGE